jgi:hypothetical protein
MLHGGEYGLNERRIGGGQSKVLRGLHIACKLEYRIWSDSHFFPLWTIAI